MKKHILGLMAASLMYNAGSEKEPAGGGSANSAKDQNTSTVKTETTNTSGETTRVSATIDIPEPPVYDASKDKSLTEVVIAYPDKYEGPRHFEEGKRYVSAESAQHFVNIGIATSKGLKPKKD